MKTTNKISAGQIAPPIQEPNYDSESAMYASQSGQVRGFLQYVTGIGYFRYLGSTNGDGTDYTKVSSYNVLHNTGTQKVALKDDTAVDTSVGKHFDHKTTAYASVTELLNEGYTAENGYLQGSEIIMAKLTSGYKRYEKITDTDTDWMVYDNSTGWTVLPV